MPDDDDLMVKTFFLYCFIYLKQGKQFNSIYMGDFKRLSGTHFSLIYRIEKKDRLFFLIFHRYGRVIEDDIYKKVVFTSFYSG